jgi:outer membrane protein TolC
MRISLFALIPLTGFTASLLAGESSVGYRSHALTIDEAVQIAIKQNPNILRQVQELKRTKGLVYEAQARLFPQVTASTNYTQEDPALVPRTTAGGRINYRELDGANPSHPIALRRRSHLRFAESGPDQRGCYLLHFA